MQPQTPKFNSWLAVEKEAQAAERKLHAEMRKSAIGASAAGLADLALIAQTERAKAQSLFDDAMQELKTLAASLHHRRIDSQRESSSAEGNPPY